MPTQSGFWTKTVFQIVVLACLTFVVVTVVAMFTYAGGTNADHNHPGYAFFTNFFSDLGRTIAYNDQPNSLSMFLFSSALTFAGLGLALFFIAFARFFPTPRWAQVLSLLGSLFGVASALCFIGVAFTPADLAPAAHGTFVRFAFGLFPVAVICYIPVILKRDFYPNIYAISFIAFAAILILYFALISFGPRASTPEGLLIQATGQKVIVYASILSILFQALGALNVYKQLHPRL